jgi:hypothetical protein
MTKKFKKLTEDYVTEMVGSALLKMKINNKKMQTIKWYRSKTLWFNVVMTVIGISTVLASVPTFDKYAVAIGLVTTIGNVILRVWFTKTNIATV